MTAACCVGGGGGGWQPCEYSFVVRRGPSWPYLRTSDVRTGSASCLAPCSRPRGRAGAAVAAYTRGWLLWLFGNCCGGLAVRWWSGCRAWRGNQSPWQHSQLSCGELSLPTAEPRCASCSGQGQGHGQGHGQGQGQGQGQGHRTGRDLSMPIVHATPAHAWYLCGSVTFPPQHVRATDS
jgi:hypothetical protein